MIYLHFFILFFLGFRTRKQLQEQEDLPDLKCADVAAATVQIQKVFRGYQARKKVEELKADTEEMPNLKDPQLATAAVKIQSVYRGFQTRQKVKPRKWADMVMAAITIQRAYR